MKREYKTGWIIPCIVVIMLSMRANASTGEPRIMARQIVRMMRADTVSPASTAPAIQQKLQENIIREVPKSRRLPAPLPINTPAIPVKTIRPKIIKPVIKVGH